MYLTLLQANGQPSQPGLPKGSGGGALVNLNNVLYYMGGERATDTERNAPRKNTFYLDPTIFKPMD